MSDVLSPSVVTSEHDLSFIAPAISTSIAAVQGAARKGKVNDPVYLTTPSQFEEQFGAPLLEDYAGHAAILYLKQANMLWFNRVGSLRGSDPVATANTDTRATLNQTDVTAFLVPSDIMTLSNPNTKYLRLRFDSESGKDITIRFTAAICASLVRATLNDTLQALVNFINTQLSGNDTFEPRYGYATHVAVTGGGRKIRIYSESKTGPYSKIEVLAPTLGSDAAGDFGWTSGVTHIEGERTVMVTIDMTAAQIDSSLAGAAGAFDLGTAASEVSAEIETFNLGEFAAGEMIDIFGTADGHSMILTKESTSLANINDNLTPSFQYTLYTQLKAAPYSTINPYIRMYIDGYTVEFQVPLTTWPAAGSVTAANMQNLVSIINAASPAQLGTIAYWNATTGTIVIQSGGKTSSYSYIQIPEQQPDSPVNNGSAARLFLMVMGMAIYTDGKVQNQLLLDVDDDIYTVSLNYATLTSQGYHPALLSNAQMISTINSQTGLTLASSGGTLDVDVANATPGIYGHIKMYGREWSRTLTDSTHSYNTDLAYPGWYKPDLGTKSKLTNWGPNTISGTDVNSILYVKFEFGTDWAWVALRNVQYETVKESFAVADIALLSSSIPLTSVQETAFRTLLSDTGSDLIRAVGVQAVSGANGAYSTYDAVWPMGNPADGTILSIHQGGPLGPIVGTVMVNETDDTGNVEPERYSISYYHLTGNAPAEGDGLDDLGGNTNTIERIYNDREVGVYINNSGPITMAGVNCTGIGDTYVVYREDASIAITLPGDIAPYIGVNDYFAVAAGDISTAAATSVYNYDTLQDDYPGGSILLVLAIDFTIGGNLYTAIVAVVPNGATYFSHGLARVDTAIVGSEPAVDLITLCPANGQDVTFTQAGSFAYIDSATGTLQVNLVGVTTTGAGVLTTVRYGVVHAGSEPRFTRSVSSTPGAAAGPSTWATQNVYNPLTNQFNVGVNSLILLDDFGEGWNLFGLEIDDAYNISIDFNDYAFTDQSAATASEVSNALNLRAKAVNLSLDGIAAVTNSGGVQITSSTKGLTSKVLCSLDNPALDFSNITVVPAQGSGYPLFAVSIDENPEFSINFGDYVGDLIQNQSLTTASEVAAVIRRAMSITTSQCWDSGIGALSQIHLASAAEGEQGSVEVTTANIALGGGFSVVDTTVGTETTVTAGTCYALTPGTWANQAEDAVKLRFTDESALFYAPNSSRIDIIANGVSQETYRGIVPNPDADGDTTNNGTGVFIEDALGNATSVAQDENPSEYVYFELDEETLEGGGYTTTSKFQATSIGSEYDLTGGANGINALDEFDLIGVANHAVWGSASGLQVWRDKDTRFVNIMVTPGATQSSVIQEMLSICEYRGDCMCIIDPPFGLKPTQVLDWSNGAGYGNDAALNSSYGALYNTWILYSDPYNQEKVWLPPSCFMLAVYAYSDRVSESWFAPAGLTRGKVAGALALQYTPTFGERELLYGTGNSINCIVDFYRDGIVAWGQKTLQRTASALDRVNVRRLLLYLRTMAELTAKVMVFEPNDPISRRKLVNMLEGIANDVMRRRGLRRAKVEDKTTSRHINQKRARIVFFLEPTQTMEIIEIPFIITGAGQAFIDIEA